MLEKEKKNSLSSLLCSNFTRKSSFVSLVLRSSKQPPVLCTLRDKKKKKKLKISSQSPCNFSVGRVVKREKKYQFTMGQFIKRQKLIAYSLCVLPNPAVKCCCNNTRAGEYTEPMSSLIDRHVARRSSGTKARKQKSNNRVRLIPWQS